MDTLRSAFRRTSRNIVQQLAASGLQYLFLLAVNILIGRTLGRTGLGVFSYLTALTLPLWIAMELGIDNYLVRELAAAPAQAVRLCARATRLRIRAALMLVAVAAVVALLTIDDAVARAGFLFLAGGFLARAVSATAYSFLRSQQRYFEAMRMEVVGAAILATAAVVLLPRGAGLVPLFAVMLGIEIVKLLVGARIYRRELRASLLGALIRREATEAPLLRTLLPFAAVNVLVVVNGRVDVLVLQALHGYDVVGAFTAAERFLNVSVAFPAAVFNAILPVLVLQRERGLAARTARIALFGFSAIGLVVSGALFVVAPTLIGWTFHFDESVVLLRILCWSFLFLMFNTVGEAILYSRHRERAVLAMRVFGLLTAVTLNIVLAGPYRALGTAAAVTCSEALLAIAVAITLSTRLGAARTHA